MSILATNGLHPSRTDPFLALGLRVWNDSGVFADVIPTTLSSPTSRPAGHSQDEAPHEVMALLLLLLHP
jgi:hypothetical protein